MPSKSPSSLNPTRAARILALGEALNALVSQSRAVTTRAAATFHDELQPAAFPRRLVAWSLWSSQAQCDRRGRRHGRNATSRLIRELARLNLVDTRNDSVDGRGVLACLSSEGRRPLDLAMAQKAGRVQRTSTGQERRMISPISRRCSDGSPLPSNGIGDAPQPARRLLSRSQRHRLAQACSPRFAA